jgi:D-beta-D-heptose 7-phosphate kinase/D-beta-D-heptose 1-phosphate adenosyltransferase
MLDFSNLSVLVIGDICLDIITEGPSYRQSPEAPVPVILNPTATYSMGMAANVAHNIHTLGANVGFTFVIGHDDEKTDIFKELIKNNFGKVNMTEGTEDEKQNYKITTKHRIIANNQQVARLDFERSLDILKVKKFISSLEEKVNNNLKYDLIIISDYNKGIITRDSWSIIKPLLLQLSDKIFVDTKKLNVLDFYEGMYIFPNKKEMNALLEFNNCKTRNELRQEMDLDFIVETASEEGAYLYKNDGKMYHCPVFKSNVVDICGAGDTFLAAFALYYTKYNDKKAALGFANYCCSKVIERRGTTPVLLHEVMNFDSQSI